eukprot:ctg_698.g351
MPVSAGAAGIGGARCGRVGARGRTEVRHGLAPQPLRQRGGQRRHQHALRNAGTPAHGAAKACTGQCESESGRPARPQVRRVPGRLGAGRPGDLSADVDHARGVRGVWCQHRTPSLHLTKPQTPS